MKKASQAASVASLVAVATALAAAAVKVASGGGRVAAHQRLQPHRSGVAAVDSQRRPLRGDEGPPHRLTGRAAGGARRAVRDPDRRGRRQAARRHEGRADEGRPARELHLRDASGGSAGGARHAAGGRRADVAVTRGVGRRSPSSARRQSGCSSTGATCRWRRRASGRSIARSPTTASTSRSRCSTPGVDAAIESDLDAAEMMYAMFSAMMLKGLDAKSTGRRAPPADARGARLRARSGERPRVRADLRRPSVGARAALDPRAVDAAGCSPPSGSTGMSFEEFRRTASPATKQRAGEVIWRFAQHAVLRHGAFNGDPHPGNYKFHHDGSVTFLDFGLVKRWSRRRVGDPGADARRDRRATRSAPARRGDGGERIPASSATASTPTSSTTTSAVRTSRI